MADTPNAKDPAHEAPVDLPGVKPKDYIPGTKGMENATGSGLHSRQEGTKGFEPNIAGRGKAGHSETASFDLGPPDYALPGYPTSKETAKPEGGLEERGKREPTTSVVGRVSKGD